MSYRNWLVPLYTFGVIGALMQIWGGSWDLAWHALNLVETFFTPPHTVLYSGIALALGAGVVGLVITLRIQTGEGSDTSLVRGLRIALAGGVIQVVAGPLDFWWHSVFGFDPFLFTPSHAMLVLGIVLNTFGMAVGSARLLSAYRSGLELGSSPYLSRWLQILVILSLTTLWLGLNAAVYLATDVDGIAYTFQLGREFVNQTARASFAAVVVLLSLTGTLVLFSAKSILRLRGMVTLIALLLATIEVTSNLGFRALTLGNRAPGQAISAFIPLYLSFLVPLFIFDLFLQDPRKRPIMLATAALVSPFAAYVDGWYSLNLWSQSVPASCPSHWVCGGVQLVPILLIPMLVAGLVAGLSRVWFLNTLVPDEMAALTRRV